MAGPLGRPPLHLPRILAYMETVDQDHLGVDAKTIAFALDLKTTQVGSALSNHIKSAGPNAKVARIKPSVFRLTSAAERGRKLGRERKVKTLKKIVNATDTITSTGGWVAPASDGPELAAFQIKRGGITFPPALAAGLKMDDAVVAHVGSRSGESDENDIYFVWRGKMWKAYQI